MIRTWVHAIIAACLLTALTSGCRKAEQPVPHEAKTAGMALSESCEARRIAAQGGAGGRIVGGEPARPGSAPWQAELLSSPGYSAADRAYDAGLADGDPCKIYLKQRQDYELAHKCGGAYIGDGWVITAAHCVANMPSFDGRPGNVLTDRSIRLGSQNLTVKDGIFAVDAVVVHQGYSSGRKLDDIALVRVKPDGRIAAFLAAGRLSPVHLMTAQDRAFDPDEGLRVTGWGWMGARGKDDPVTRRDSQNQLQRNPADLQQLSLNYLPDAVCKAEYGALYDAGTLCAGTLGADGKVEAGKDSCQGDSGGPLTRQEEGTARSLVGLVSNGKGCGAGIPGVYTRISHYDAWIAAARRAAVSGAVISFAEPDR